ncbi:hypothetical protein GCM10027270_13710 [Nocardioides ginkgobilobae]
MEEDLDKNGRWNDYLAKSFRGLGVGLVEQCRAALAEYDAAQAAESAPDRAVRETVAAMPPIPNDVRDEIARLLTRAWAEGQTPA